MKSRPPLAAALSFAVSAALLPAQEPPQLELPETERWFAERDEESRGAVALVVARAGHATWQRFAGAIDADGAVPLDGEQWLPVGSGWLLELAFDRCTARGVDAEAKLAEVVPQLVATVGEAFGEFSWGDLRSGRIGIDPYYRRDLLPGEPARPLDEVLAAHVFADPGGGTAYWHAADVALKQGAIEERFGCSWQELVEGEARDWCGGVRLLARRPDDAPQLAIQGRDDSAEIWRQPEVAAAGATQLWSGDLTRLAEHFVAADEQAFGGFGVGDGRHRRRTWASGLANPRLRGRRYGGEMPLVVFAWSTAGPQPAYELLDRVERDVLGPVEEAGDAWNSAVGLGGGAGGRYGGRVREPRLDRELVGAWRALVPSVSGEPVPLQLEVPSRQPGELRLRYGDERLAVRGDSRDARIDVRGYRGDEELVDVYVRFENGIPVGRVLARRGAHEALPWRLTFEPAEMTAARDLRLADVFEKLQLAALLEAADTSGHVVAVAQGDGFERVIAVGPCDPSSAVTRMLRAREPLPLGALSGLAAGLALIGFEDRGQLRLGDRVAPLWPADEGFVAALRGLEWWQLLDAGSLRSGSGYHRRIESEDQRRELIEILRLHGFRQPTWVASDARSEFGVALLVGCLQRKGLVREEADLVSGPLNRQLGTRLTTPATRSEVLASPLRFVDADGVGRPARLGEVLLAGGLWGTAADALRLGRAALVERLGQWPGAATSFDPRRSGLARLRWTDDAGGAVRRLVVVPEHELVLFVFNNGGDLATADEVERRVLDVFEPGGPQILEGPAFDSSGWDTEPPTFDAPGAYTAELDFGGGAEQRLRLVVAEDGRSVIVRVDGEVCECEVEDVADDALRVRARLDDEGAELLIAIRTAWLGLRVECVIWRLREGVEALPIKVALKKSRG